MSSSRRPGWPPGNSARRPSSRSATLVAYPTTSPERGRSDLRAFRRSLATSTTVLDVTRWHGAPNAEGAYDQLWPT